MKYVLQASNITKLFGGNHALRGVSFALARGEAHALIGENGAGKSTLSKILAGSERADGGTILFDDHEVAISSPLDAQRLGIGMIYQELDLFPHLTVAENMVAGNLSYREGMFASPARMRAFCQPYLRQVGLDRGADVLVGELSIGEMQLVAIARALSMNARVLLMDEPTSCLFDDSVDRLFQLIAQLKASGVAIVYVSHKMEEIFRICDRITVLRDGEAVGTRVTSETSADEIIRMMVGRELSMATRDASGIVGEKLLEVRGLTTAKLRDVSFELRRGEVLGIAGLVGAGRSELGAALFGLDRRMSGSAVLRGANYAPGSAREAMDAGVGLVPEDRKLQGLMMRMQVIENATLGILSRLSSSGVVSRTAEERAVQPWFGELAVKAGKLSDQVSLLSGGNQQKVLLTKCLMANPDVVFLDDPARGIDVGAKQDIYRAIRKLAADGKGVLLVSSELPELLLCSDRILVMREGRVSASLAGSAMTQEAIMRAAVHSGAAA